MLKKLPISIVFLLFTVLNVCQSQDNSNTLYHRIEFTASSVKLLEWDIIDTVNTEYVKELIDLEGRTKELRFYDYKNKLNYTGSGFLGGPIIRYRYSKGKIIETYYDSSFDIAHDLRYSEIPYRVIYHLDKNDQIMDIEFIHSIDLHLTEKDIKQTIKILELYKDKSFDELDLKHVFGYQFSQAKFNGVNPTMSQ